jgi:hypothetical protein
MDYDGEDFEKVPLEKSDRSSDFPLVAWTKCSLSKHKDGLSLVDI